MTGPFFVDTNLLVYADDKRNPEKQARARQLLRELIIQRSGKLSLQVLQEFFVTATQKLGLTAEEARRRIEVLAHLDVVRLDVDDVLAAVDLHRLHQVSLWDALVIRAAIVSGCRTLYTEDLQHGRRFDGVRIVSPFHECD